MMGRVRKPAALLVLVAVVVVVGAGLAAAIGSGGAPSPSLYPNATPAATPAAVVPSLGPSAAASPPPAAPVATSLPAGVRAGSLVTYTMPAPWVGGHSSTVEVAVYLPAGYAAGGARRYPVVYEVPYGVGTWVKGMNLLRVADVMIARHEIPPEIFVFAGVGEGPYRDSECADSLSGRERVESFIVGTLVPWVDRRFPTIRSRLARAVMGASQGGYCAAALWSHHPDVFGASLIESGYFTSGIRSAETPNAWMPFGGQAAYEQAQSPINVVPKIAAPLRAASLVLIEASPSETFYGPQATAFDAVLKSSGVPFVLYPNPAGHSWTAFGPTTREMLVAFGRWMTSSGVVAGHGA